MQLGKANFNLDMVCKYNKFHVIYLLDRMQKKSKKNSRLVGGKTVSVCKVGSVVLRTLGKGQHD